MRNVLIILAVLFLAACGRTEAEREAADLERRQHEVSCDMIQEEADRLDHSFMTGMYDMAACRGDTERYGVLIERAEQLECRNFRHTNMNQISCEINREISESGAEELESLGEE